MFTYGAVVAFAASTLCTYALTTPSLAKEEKTPMAAAFEAETYSEHGEMTGCGISFLASWVSGATTIFAVSGSLNFFVLSEKKGVATGIKVTGVVNGKLTPVTFAWISAEGYRKMTDFTPSQSEVAGTFLGLKYSEPKSSALPLSMAHSGFVLGVSFQGLPIDEVVQLPPAPADVTKKIAACTDELQAARRWGQFR